MNIILHSVQDQRDLDPTATLPIASLTSAVTGALNRKSKADDRKCTFKKRMQGSGKVVLGLI